MNGQVIVYSSSLGFCLAKGVFNHSVETLAPDYFTLTGSYIVIQLILAVITISFIKIGADKELGIYKKVFCIRIFNLKVGGALLYMPIKRLIFIFLGIFLFSALPSMFYTVRRLNESYSSFVFDFSPIRYFHGLKEVYIQALSPETWIYRFTPNGKEYPFIDILIEKYNYSLFIFLSSFALGVAGIQEVLKVQTYSQLRNARKSKELFKGNMQSEKSFVFINSR